MAFISLTIVFIQYKSQDNKHERLLTSGQKAKIVAKQYTTMRVNYANYYFITSKGKKIESTEKCGNDFERYTNATAIYNPSKPNEYELSFNFDTFNPTWRIIFFYFIYFPIMTFVNYNFVKFGLAIYFSFKK